MQYIHPKSPRAWSFVLKVALIEKRKKEEEEERAIFFPGKVFDVFNCIHYLSIAVSHTTSNRCWHKWYYAATLFHQHCSPEFVSPIFSGNGAAFILFDVISGKKERGRETEIKRGNLQKWLKWHQKRGLKASNVWNGRETMISRRLSGWRRRMEKKKKKNPAKSNLKSSVKL